MKLNGLNPERVMYYFEEISKIPRGSYNEKEISLYLKKFGEGLGLETIQDSLGNIVIRKPASAGYESKPGVVLQGHMDMVCEKELDSNHDFTKDGIDLQIRDGWITGNKTTLGADNGIAVAMTMAIFEDTTLKHPPLEMLVTIAEETEMDGALGLSDSILHSQMMLNIDSEGEGIITVGSAGGELLTLIIDPQFEQVTKNVVVLKLAGLLGGHSGIEIDKKRGNIIKVMAHFMDSIQKISDATIVAIDSGTKDNAIPREGDVSIALSGHSAEITKKVDEVIKEMYRNYSELSEKFSISYELVKEKTVKAMSRGASEKLTAILHELPTGVNSFLPTDASIVESSSNLAVIRLVDGKYEVQDSTRSSSNKIHLELREKIATIAKKHGVDYRVTGGYPSWEYRLESPLREKAKEVYSEVYKKECEIAVIHAGLECGAICEKYPNMDIISIGPNIQNAHTPQECLSIDSAERVYNYILALLERL